MQLELWQHQPTQDRYIVLIDAGAVGDGATGSVTCHIVTAAGREDDRTMTFYGRHE